MSTSRTMMVVGVAFVVSQVLAVVVHGIVLAADYESYRGTLLRPGPAWQMLFLPVAHLSFVSALVWVATRLRLEGTPIRRGLTLGLVGWGIGQVPLWLLWYAEQPWLGALVVKQLGLELVSSILIGLSIVAVLRSPANESVPSRV